MSKRRRGGADETFGVGLAEPFLSWLTLDNVAGGLLGGRDRRLHAEGLENELLDRPFEKFGREQRPRGARKRA
jgi:hypothetical protein